MEVAFRSLSSIYVISEQTDLSELFSFINDNELIDRLYRRYVRREEAEDTLSLLKAKSLDDKNMRLHKILVEKFEKEIEHAEYFFKRFGEYIPIRIIISDMPYPLIEEEIPLEDYDNLEGDPFWMRPEYMLERYG